MVDGLVVESAEFLDGPMRVGARLEVGDELLRLVAVREDLDAALDPSTDGGARQSAIGAGAAVVAVDATAGRDGAIDVGAGEAGVDGDAADARDEALAEVGAEGTVAAGRGRGRISSEDGPPSSVDEREGAVKRSSGRSWPAERKASSESADAGRVVA